MAHPDFNTLLLGITWESPVIFPEPWVTPLAKIHVGKCWSICVPNLWHLQWPFQFYKKSFPQCTGLVFTCLVTHITAMAI